jgi:hypothetical protein
VGGDKECKEAKDKTTSTKSASSAIVNLRDLLMWMEQDEDLLDSGRLHERILEVVSTASLSSSLSEPALGCTVGPAQQSIGGGPRTFAVETLCSLNMCTLDIVWVLDTLNMIPKTMGPDGDLFGPSVALQYRGEWISTRPGIVCGDHSLLRADMKEAIGTALAEVEVEEKRKAAARSGTGAGTGARADAASMDCSSFGRNLPRLSHPINLTFVMDA